MQSERFDQWLVSDLKTLLLQYDIDTKDIKGSGKNGNLIKKDYVRMAYQLTFVPEIEVKENIIDENIWYNIMLNMTDDLHKICMANKMALKVCHNKYFWENKFKHDDLTLFSNPTSMKEWINEYDKSFKAYTLANKIANALMKGDKIITYFDGDKDLSNIVSETDRRKARGGSVGDFIEYQGITITFKKNITFSYFLQDKYGGTAGKSKYEITLDQLFNLLYKLLYYHPNIELVDDNSFSYIPETLAKQLQNIHKKNKKSLFVQDIYKRLSLLQ